MYFVRVKRKWSGILFVIAVLFIAMENKFEIVHSEGLSGSKKAEIFVVTKRSDKYGDDIIRYTKDGLITSIYSNIDYDYTYDSKGNLTECIPDHLYSDAVHLEYKNNKISILREGSQEYTFKYKDGKIVKIIDRSDGYTKRKIKYDKNGRMKECNMVGEMEGNFSFSWDKNGNHKSVHYSYRLMEVDYTFKNTYDKQKCLKKQVVLQQNELYDTLKYRYKKIKVPQKYLSRIKRQQWTLINADYYCVLGGKYLAEGGLFN